jgi:hypothetical protein
VKNIHFQNIVYTFKKYSDYKNVQNFENFQILKNVQISKYIQISKIIQVLKNIQISNFLVLLEISRKKTEMRQTEQRNLTRNMSRPIYSIGA